MPRCLPAIAGALLMSLCAAASAAPAPVSLGLFSRGDDGWQLSLGPEFPGARGSGARTADGPRPGDSSLALHGDFSGGGNYVSVGKPLEGAAAVKRIWFWVKADNVNAVGLRLVDSTGQTLQQQIPLEPGGGWQQAVVPKIAPTAHWGGANDGVWHGPAARIELLLQKAVLANKSAGTGTLLLSDIEADEEHSPAAAASPSAASAPVLGFELHRKPMYFWGKNDAPQSVTLVVSDAPGAECAVRLLNYKGETVRELWKGVPKSEPGNPFRQEIEITPPAYGVFYVVASLGKQRLGAPFAWLAAAAQPWTGSPFGVQTHFSMGPWGMHQNLGGAAGTLELARNMGASWIRDEIAWSAVEKEKGRFAVPMDAKNPYFFITPASARQLQLLININGRNVFYDGQQPPHSDAALAAFKQFAIASAKKWGPVVKTWEVWNEPNIAPGWPGRTPDPEEYTAVLKATYEGIKSVDPNLKVIGLAASGVDLKFASEVLRLGGAKYMDAISVHAYQRAAPEFANEKPNGGVGMGLPDAGKTLVGQLKNLKALLDRYDAGNLKIWITEIGCVPRESGFSEAQVAAYNVRAYLLALALPYVQEIVKYNFQDRGAPDSEHWDYVLGMVRADGSPKPSYAAYNTMARMLYKKHFVRAHPVGEGSYLYEFSGDGGTVFAAWSSKGSKTLSVETGAGQVCRVDLMGNQTSMPAGGQPLKLELTEEPVFITCDAPLKPRKP